MYFIVYICHISEKEQASMYLCGYVWGKVLSSTWLTFKTKTTCAWGLYASLHLIKMNINEQPEINVKLQSESQSGKLLKIRDVSIKRLCHFDLSWWTSS